MDTSWKIVRPSTLMAAPAQRLSAQRAPVEREEREWCRSLRGSDMISMPRRLALRLVCFSALATGHFCWGQTIVNSAVIDGTSIIKGPSTVNTAQPTQNTAVYVVFPPAVDPSGGKNNANFRTY